MLLNSKQCAVSAEANTAWRLSYQHLFHATPTIHATLYSGQHWQLVCQTHQGIVLQSGFQDVEVLGVVPLPPLPDQDLPTAKKQLETFRSEAGVILAEANAADDLAAPLAVAAAEAENLTLDQLGTGSAADCRMYMVLSHANMSQQLIAA